MDNGLQVVAKLPNPNAGIPYYTTASEITTMDFARTVLQIPRSAGSNPVGAEFIIMEKMPGVLLWDIWWDLQPYQKLKVFAQVVRYMKRWTNVHHRQVRSLSTSMREILLAILSLLSGQPSNREWSDKGRQDIKCDRGPWSSLVNYRKAIGDRETTAIKTLSHTPKHLAMIYGPEPLYLPTVEKKLEALQCYSQILDTLLPSDPSLTAGHLWHNDLHHENIFVDPDSLQILGIIDWQSIQIAPLTDHCLDASFLDYQGSDVGDNLS
ncbi:hypothetical protein AJ80_09042 [Polytolypa hystricis UAMH7299]|uniref:Aminoglycoside phosphotransferase domain-containing protein n=1 Tax=Polytolypa hystricis (strain UAMH7299) TaxID=1447883 RepID=A0A2B7WXU9_POLH7|nr:hypothetical protein AJ80_09042 [Polytolypa hystricis UAMH7299]